jgi:hypothetical protein
MEHHPKLEERGTF